MLVELSVVEQRYHAVMEVAAGVPVTQVAVRYGVSRQSVHSWVRKYKQSGSPGLTDRSHRPDSCPHRIAPEVEALVCELRRPASGLGSAQPGARAGTQRHHDGAVPGDGLPGPGPQRAHCAGEQRVLQATLPSPLPPSACGRLQEGRPAGPPPLLPPPGQQIAERTVSSVGGFMVAGQCVQLGRDYAHQVVTAHLDEETINVLHGHELITAIPRVTKKEVVEVVVRKSGENNRRKTV